MMLIGSQLSTMDMTTSVASPYIMTGNARQNDLHDFDLDFGLKKYVELHIYLKNYINLETYRQIYTAITLVLTSVIWNSS